MQLAAYGIPFLLAACSGGRLVLATPTLFTESKPFLQDREVGDRDNLIGSANDRAVLEAREGLPDKRDDVQGDSDYDGPSAADISNGYSDKLEPSFEVKRQDNTDENSGPWDEVDDSQLDTRTIVNVADDWSKRRRRTILGASDEASPDNERRSCRGLKCT